MSVVLVYTLYGDPVAAEAAVRAMVEGGFAACANILSPSESIYRWNGLVEKQREIPVLFKTSAERREALLAALGESHPYDLPALLSWDAAATAGFSQWVAAGSTAP